ncbi:MAG: hypothetical protein M3450_12580 [Actinomycetota bacterium]|nr:hypothetical protein [Actinomycetota bacterium]
MLDEHLSRIVAPLNAREIQARAVGDFHAKSTLDPDVVRAVAAGMKRRSWVLVTMDSSIIEEHRGFGWDRHAIAWVVIDAHLRGATVERAKTEIVQRYAHAMVEQRPGDHHTYRRNRHYKHPPGLIARRW